MNGYEFALAALDRQIQTIPLTMNNGSKKPLIKFKDFGNLDKAFIDSYRQDYQFATALGVLCRGVWCIDIDVGHNETDNGYQSIKNMIFYDELVGNGNHTWKQITPSGGMHIVFKKRAGIEYSQKINYLRGVDIKAHENNYFVMGGSVTPKGVYKKNGLQAINYEGEFENRIFNLPGSYQQQIEEKYSARNVLSDYDFSHVHTQGGNGKGKAAYQRILDGMSYNRNNDLFLAASYAKACNVDIKPLTVLINDNKNGDIFTEKEFWATLNSAR